MVENVITSRLEIQGYENIKQIKDEITKLRQQMKELATGTEEYKATADQLVRTEYDLKQAMAAQKKDSSALKGSYNELVNQMGALKKVWRETTDEAVRADYGAQINALNTQLKELDATTGNYQRNVGDYKNQLKEAKAELANLTEGTAEYNAKLKECAEISHNLREQQELIKNSSSDLGDQLDNIVGIGSSLASGFSALQAGMGLFGKKSEEIQKVMLRVQQSMQLVQGLKGMEGLWKKTKQLSNAWNLVRATTTEATVAIDVNTISTEANAAAEANAATQTNADTIAKQGQIVATKGAEKAQRGLNAAMKANPLGFVIGLVASLAAAITTVIHLLPSAKKEEEKRIEGLKEEAKWLKEQIELNEALGGAEYKYTKEARENYQEYFNYMIEATKMGSEERHQVMVDYFNWQREMREHDREEERKIEQERLEALEEYVNKMKDGVSGWESLVSRVAQTDKEKIHDEIVGYIDEWNSFMEMLPKNAGRSFEINITKEAKANFQKEISQLLEIFDEGLTKPMIQSVDDNFTAITKKSTDNIKNAFGRFKDALARDLFDALLKDQTEAMAKEEQILAKQINFITSNQRAASQRSLDDTADLINNEKELWNQKESLYDDAINSLQTYVNKIKEIYGEDTSIYKDYQKTIFELQMQYNQKKTDANLQYNENVSKINRNAAKNETAESRAEMDRNIKIRQMEFDEYNSELDRFWFKNGNLPKEYDKMLNEVYNIQSEYLNDMINNLNEYLNNEYLIAEDRAQIEEEIRQLKQEQEDLELQHTIEINERTRESYVNTYEAIKNSIQGTADIMGQWGDFYADIIDANVKQNKISQKDAEKQYKVVQGIQTAQAIVNTLAASMGAYQSLASIPYVGPALGAAAAATTLAYGYAQVRKIQATNPYSDNSLSSSEPNSNNTSVTPSIDEYSPNRVTNITGAMETENLANAITRQPIWVSVSDIDRAQNRVQVKEQETTF